MNNALAPATIRTYQTGISSYLSYCGLTSCNPLPLNEQTLQRFVASQYSRLSYKTLKVYLAGIQYWSTINGFDTNIAAMPRLYYLIRAVRRIQGSNFHRPRRQPISLHHLRLLSHRLQLMQYSDLERAMFRAATSLAFFGLLRVSEYTSQNRQSFCPETTLLVTDITFRRDYSIMFVRIKASKTDPFREGCTVRVAAIDSPLCPVTLMRSYLNLRPSGPGPLFVLQRDFYLIRQDIVLLLRRCFPGQLTLNTHSFRIGGASTAAAVGIPDSQIQILGRWSSNAYRSYLRMSDLSISNMAQALISMDHPSRTWDPVRVVLSDT